jgi:Cytochrome C'
MMRALKLLACASAFVFWTTSAVSADAPKSPKPTAGHSATLPVSLLELMRASVEIPADGIWAAQYADKLSDEDWQLAEQDSINLVVSTSLVSRAGTGKNDAKWVASPDWQAWAADLHKTALAIRAAVKAKDQKTMSPAADHLQEICEGCHTKYRPQAASDGVSRYPFYPKRELPK